MNLSAHFTLEEMTVSQQAARLGLDNEPPASLLSPLRRTAHGLESVRTLLGCPVVVISGYRSAVVNRAVGGSANSQHMLGQAADIIVPAFGTPEEVMRAILKAGLRFDQCILEFGRWVHLSFCEQPRRQALVCDNSGTKAWA